MRFRSVWISDIHLGTKHAQVGALLIQIQHALIIAVATLGIITQQVENAGGFVVPCPRNVVFSAPYGIDARVPAFEFATRL